MPRLKITAAIGFKSKQHLGDRARREVRLILPWISEHRCSVKKMEPPRRADGFSGFDLRRPHCLEAAITVIQNRMKAKSDLNDAGPERTCLSVLRMSSSAPGTALRTKLWGRNSSQPRLDIKSPL